MHVHKRTKFIEHNSNTTCSLRVSWFLARQPNLTQDGWFFRGGGGPQDSIHKTIAQSGRVDKRDT